MFLPIKTPEVLSREPYGHAVDWWSLGVIACRMLTNEFPTPAIFTRATNNGRETSPETKRQTVPQNEVGSRPAAGTLPKSAADLPGAARGLLTRLLERDPKVRMRNLRQLQQSAFYMGFNFEHVKAKKINPLDIVKKYFPQEPSEPATNTESINQILTSFDQTL